MVNVRLTDKKVEEVVSGVCGTDVLSLIRKLKGKDNISEFKLAEILKDDIKRVRNTLYRLYGANLVDFTRKKDKKKGWYIYYWTFKHDQIKYLYRRLRREQLERLRERLNQEASEQFFICVNKCVRMDFEQVVNFEYRCPECGELTAQESVGPQKQDIREAIAKLEKELKEV